MTTSPSPRPDMSLPTGVRTATLAEREQAGRDARTRRPRTSLAQFAPPADRPDPVALLAAQEVSRMQPLLPLRHSRMSASAFTFYRGAAAVMADDLAAMPNSGLITQLCGDAHLSNFGMFAAPDRSVIFDINDFDETNPGPFEWDVQRLAASFVLAGRDNSLDPESISNAALSVGFAYRTQMQSYAAMPELAIWYDRVSIDVLLQWARLEGSSNEERQIQKGEAKARSRDSWSAIDKMTEIVDGKRQFKNAPPVLMRISLDDAMAGRISGMLTEYQDTLIKDRQQLLRRYHVIDMGHKVVGVGSVGLLAFVVLLQGRDENDLLVLQVKQAVPSVLEQYTEASAYELCGERVVVGQQVMQAASDVFLGWLRGHKGRDYYIRQMRDMKFAIDPARLNESTLISYAVACGRTLARAHARSGDSVAISSYLGTSTKFDKAMRDFALAYADQMAVDFTAYQAALAAGAVTLGDDAESADYAFVLGAESGVEMVVVPASAGTEDARS